MKERNYLFIQGISKDIQYLFPFVHPDIADFIACQCACETAYGRSTIFLENKNCFGMKIAKQRLQSCLGVNREHALYQDTMQSILDYFLWLSYNAFVQSDLRYDLDSFIRNFPWSKYCPTFGYLDSIKSIYKSFKSYTNE